MKSGAHAGPTVHSVTPGTQNDAFGSDVATQTQPKSGSAVELHRVSDSHVAPAHTESGGGMVSAVVVVELSGVPVAAPAAL